MPSDKPEPSRERHVHAYGEWFTAEVERVNWDFVQGYRSVIASVQRRRCDTCGWSQEAPMETLTGSPR